MDQTAIRSGPPPGTLPSSSAITANPERLRPLGSPKNIAVRCLEVVASLRVTVVLFVFAIVLVYYGTWAQKDAGIWTVVNKYFRSYFVLMPLKTVLMHSLPVAAEKAVEGLFIPFPGGWLIGWLLLINLLAAHAVRFKVSWNRSGILLIHSGLVLMMLGEFVTGTFAVEGHMFIMQRTETNFVENDRAPEFAVVDRSDPTVDKEVCISPRRFAQGGEIKDDRLPFDVDVDQYMVNTNFIDPEGTNPATTGIGLQTMAKPRPETKGTDADQRSESPSAYVTLKEKGTGKSLGTFLVSTWFSYLQRPMEEVVVNGKRYGIALRLERAYKDYAIQLIEFKHDVWEGTEIAKNYQSDVRITDLNNPNAKKDAGKVTIKMNQPLFYENQTFYQASLHPLTTGTVLQVVHNPGWWMPYVSCILVSGGMLVHFGLHLITFLQRRLG